MNQLNEFLYAYKVGKLWYLEFALNYNYYSLVLGLSAYIMSQTESRKRFVEIITLPLQLLFSSYVVVIISILYAFHVPTIIEIIIGIVGLLLIIKIKVILKRNKK